MHSKLYGFAATSTIQYCKSILATLIRDAAVDQDGSVKYACILTVLFLVKLKSNK